MKERKHKVRSYILSVRFVRLPRRGEPCVRPFFFRALSSFVLHRCCILSPHHSIISVILIFRGNDIPGVCPRLPVIRKSTFRFKTHP